MKRSAVVEYSAGRPSRCIRTALCSMLLAAIAAGSMACQSPNRGTCPMRSLLQPSRDVHGTVSDAEGKPLSGAVVTAYEAGGKYVFGEETLSRVGRQTTGADGTFHFRVGRDVPRLYFVASRSGMGFGWSRWQELLADAPIVVQMAPAAEVAGRVVDAQRKPVAGASLSISVGESHEQTVNLGRHEPSLVARTDAQGRFRFENMPAGQSVHFEVRAKGHGRLDTVRSQEDGYLAGLTDIELQMPASASLEVTVLSKATGKPMPGVTLIAYTRGLAHEVVGSPIAGRPGHIRWTDLPPQSVAIFVATPLDRAAEWTGTMAYADLSGGKTAEAKIEVTRGQIVEILARDSRTGQPVKGYIAGSYSPQAKSGGIGYGDRDGVARLRLVPGEYQFLWTERPLYRETRRQEPFKVEAGKPLRLEVSLEMAPCYQGVVVGPDGSPVSGAAVAILGQMGSTITDATGSFWLYPSFYDTARTPAVTLLARKVAGDMAACLEVAAPDKPIEIHLRPGVAREVSVCDGDGKPIAGAMVAVTIGQDDVEPLGGRFHACTDAAGRCKVRALPAGCPLAVCVQSDGYGAKSELLDGASCEPTRVQLQKARRLAVGPAVKEIPIPATAEEDSIWGATGRDSRGHIWFAVSKRNHPNASADLFEFDPQSSQVASRGNVVDELKKAGLAKPDQQQMKIHSKLYEIDGYLYFVSMDEKGEDEQKLIQPVFGSHLWRLRLADNTWEHLLTIPEAMVSVAVGGGKVYSLGYWDHILYQYDIATGASKSVKVGTCFAHVSRNVIADGRGHVYAPRCSLVGGMPHADLVEFDEQLREMRATPLPQYFRVSANGSYGITALQPLPDGSIAMLTHNGWLTLIRPRVDGAAKVEHLGWFDPDGPLMADSLFADKSGRYLMGATITRTRVGHWVTCDLATGRRGVAPLSDGDPEQPSWHRVALYGSVTRDDQDRCYVVGQSPKKDGDGMRPLLLQVTPVAP